MADSAPSAIQPPAQPQTKRGLVKQVLSGDAVVLQGPPSANGPPPEVTVYLSGVTAPRLGKRPTDTQPGTQDEPYAWESREFLRKRLIGQMVNFVKEYTNASGKDSGKIFLGSGDNLENVTETMVAEGLLEVRAGKIPDDNTRKLLELQEKAKAAGKGKWNESNEQTAVRTVQWNIEDPRALVDKYDHKPVDAVIEMVRDGSTVRCLLLPNLEYITLQLSGVRAPSTRQGTEGKGEPYAEEAKFFVEQRLLQQDVQVVLESTSNANFIGSIIHPKGNIAESLLRDGYAKCVDWSIGLCTGGAEKLRTAERQAKEKRLRLWKAYNPSAASSANKKSFQAKVVEVVLSDSLVLQKDDGHEVKIHLSSIRLPRDAEDKPTPGRPFRPLYDVPFMFQAREYLRKKVIGKKVSVTVDYVQPASEQFPEKTCCTVKIGDINLAEQLLLRGLSKAVRYRGDDENRSSEYDALLIAEAQAEKEKKGLFADKEKGEKKGIQRITELQGDVAKSKQFLSAFQRGGKVEGVVEFVTSGSRFRIYIPKESAVITFLLGGINCPKGARSGAGGPAAQAEPFSEEATAFTRKLVLQREVELEMESLDKTGNFIGYMLIPQAEGGRPQNLSELLLTEGLASLHFTAERSSHYNALLSAESKAKSARKNLWANYEEAKVDEQAEAQVNDTTERKVTYKKFAVTEVPKGALRFYAQNVEEGPKLEKLTSELREHLKSNPPTTGSYMARRGELCAAPFAADGEWYRARVESTKAGQAEILFVDYGNRQTIESSKLAHLPGQFSSFPPAAKEFALALAAIPNDNEYSKQCTEVLTHYLFTVGTVDLNVEYRVGSLEYVQVMLDVEGKRTDLAKELIENGFALADKRREARLQPLVEQYAEAEKVARRRRLNIWEFGDFTGIEA